MNRRLLLLFGIALLVIATSWISQQQDESGKTEITGKQPPDYFIRTFSSTVTDPQGRASQRLNATTLYHYPDNDLTTLEQPDITVTNKDGSQWHATADNGEMHGGEQRTLLLRDNVVLRKLGQDKVTLNTQWLRIESERRYAETDAPVTIDAPAGHIEGIGLNLYGDEQRLVVRAAVKGQYETE
jgi:lipopolysaccharide export system protein LptC